jgi:hypothetical protein
MVIDAAMSTIIIVPVNIPMDGFSGLGNGFIGIQINLFFLLLAIYTLPNKALTMPLIQFCLSQQILDYGCAQYMLLRKWGEICAKSQALSKTSYVLF